MKSQFPAEVASKVLHTEKKNIRQNFIINFFMSQFSLDYSNNPDYFNCMIIVYLYLNLEGKM